MKNNWNNDLWNYMDKISQLKSRFKLAYLETKSLKICGEAFPTPARRRGYVTPIVRPFQSLFKFYTFFWQKTTFSQNYWKRILLFGMAAENKYKIHSVVLCANTLITASEWRREVQLLLTQGTEKRQASTTTSCTWLVLRTRRSMGRSHGHGLKSDRLDSLSKPPTHRQSVRANDVILQRNKIIWPLRHRCKSDFCQSATSVSDRIGTAFSRTDRSSKSS